MQVLTVIDNYKPVVASILHRMTHNLGIHHRAAVIGHGNRTGLLSTISRFGSGTPLRGLGASTCCTRAIEI